MLLTIEKVIILKTTSIFSGTPDPLLAEVATILKEPSFKAGETIFLKNDPGRSMFIIIDGRVRVHDGDRTIATLGPRDVFGELAALDPEPRLATVTAEEDMRLFELEQDTLYDLMEENIDVARGIIHVLCQRLRGKKQ